MKNLLMLLFLVSTFYSCALTSRTVIGPQKAFELGEGNHGAFKAVIKNDGEVAVDIYQATAGGTESKIITLQPGKMKTVKFDADTKAIFKNTSDKQAAVVLKVTGDTGLSMGGPNY